MRSPVHQIRRDEVDHAIRPPNGTRRLRSAVSGIRPCPPPASTIPKTLGPSLRMQHVGHANSLKPCEQRFLTREWPLSSGGAGVHVEPALVPGCGKSSTSMCTAWANPVKTRKHQVPDFAAGHRPRLPDHRSGPGDGPMRSPTLRRRAFPYVWYANLSGHLAGLLNDIPA